MTESQKEMLAEAYEALQRIYAIGIEEKLELSVSISPDENRIWVGCGRPFPISFREPFFHKVLDKTPAELKAWEDDIRAEIKERSGGFKARRIAELEAEIAKLKEA